MTARPHIVLGTHNRKKGDEMAELLAPLGIKLRTLADFPQAIEVVETGDTFRENARLKATEQAIHLGQWVLGEDSGIRIDALDGRPGVYSARYSGEDATDQSNNDLLLKELADLALEKRTSHYACCMMLSDLSGEIRAQSEGICRGRIRFEPAGSAGFGYDPLFELPEYHRTFGQLGGAVKACLSHRARAMRKLVPQLEKLRVAGAW